MSAPVAVVTGASRGIGRAVALALADRGCDVALLALNEPRLAAVAREIEERGRRAVALACDVARSADVDRARDRVLAELGAPAVVVANAGIVHRVLVTAMTEEQWDSVVDVNLKGTFLVARAFLPSMLAARTGRIVAVASISATMGTPLLSAYCASKWGTVGFVKSLAEELRGTGLQTMCVMPGSVDTDMLRGSGYPPDMTPEDVAKTVTFLGLDAPDAMNGSCVESFGP